jgi:2-desacetyl-2-hydroxyethyl bacteriochlorophyllide A dehydrogenase
VSGLPAKRRALVFRGPRAVEVVEEACPVPGPGEVLVKTRVSALSAGTELLAYRGQLPTDMVVDETLPGMTEARFRYPFRYGYASVGGVTALGSGVEPDWRGRRVFGFVPHASAFVASINDLFVVPDGVSDEVAPLYATAETATNLVLDGRPLLGERVVIFGQGSVGLLLTAILARFPLRDLRVVEPVAARAAVAQRLGATVVAAAHDADLTFEVSGRPEVLDAAIAATGAEGRVVVGSFYGEKRAAVALGGHFHRGRLRLISSQVSHIAPDLRARWDRARRMALAWEALAQIDAGVMTTLLSHRFPFTAAADAYGLLDRNDPGNDPATLQVLLVHD